MFDDHLMIFHIGPVQEFIASARRSRDLWFGSWMLSELSKTAAQEIVEQNGGDAEWTLIFPSPENLAALRSPEFNVANRIVARTRKDPVKIGEAVRVRVLKRLREFGLEVFDRIGRFSFDHESAAKQIDDLLELFWVSYPLNEDYLKARMNAEALMAARKVTREFAPSDWGDWKEKSSLDGLRESVIPEEAYLTMTQSTLRTKYGIRPSERLCGVGLMKRHGRRGEGDDFLSTSHVASQPLLGRLDENHKSAVNEFISTLKGLGMSHEELNTVYKLHPVFGRTDGHLLYSERLSEFFEKDSLELAQGALNRLLKEVFDGDKPGTYYALLHADGDHMGKAINAQHTIEGHRVLSRCASAFAKEVGTIVDRHKGSLIYAGGDDVLAMLPLHTALGCAKALAQVFSKLMSSFIFENGQNHEPGCPTLSVGLAIVHHLEPLSEALRLAYEALDFAKTVPGKNALAITLNKRGGAEQTVGGTWGEIEDRMEDFINLYRESEIPAELAYELRQVASALGDTEKKPTGNLHDLLTSEVKRILSRKKAKRGAERIKEKVANQLVKVVEKEKLSVIRLADELIIAREFASAYELAFSKSSTPCGKEE